MVLSTSPEQIGWSKEPEKPNYLDQEASSSPTRLYVLPRPTFYHDPRTSSFSVVSDITAESIQEETSSGEDFTPSHLYINQPDPEETEGSALSLLWDDTNSLDTVGSTTCSARSRCRRPSPGQRRERNPELTSQAVSDTPDNAPSSSPRRSRGLHPSRSSAKRRSASASSSNSSSCSSVLPSSSPLTHTRTRSQSFSLEPTIMETSNGYLSPAPRPIPTPRSVRFNPRTLLRTAYGSYSSDRSGELDLASPAVSFIGWRFPNAKAAGKRRAMSLSVERSASIDNWTAFYGSIGSTPRPGGTSLVRSSTEPSLYPSRSMPGSSYLSNAPLLTRLEDPLARPDLISDNSEPPWWERIWEGSFWAQKFGGCCSFLSLEDEDWSGSISSIDRGVRSAGDSNRGFF